MDKKTSPLGPIFYTSREINSSRTWDNFVFNILAGGSALINCVKLNIQFISILQFFTEQRRPLERERERWCGGPQPWPTISIPLRQRWMDGLAVVPRYVICTVGSLSNQLQFCLINIPSHNKGDLGGRSCLHSYHYSHYLMSGRRRRIFIVYQIMNLAKYKPTECEIGTDMKLQTATSPPHIHNIILPVVL